MMVSIAVQAYFNWMRKFLTRQGFDRNMQVVYGADAEGPQRLLDQNMADKPVDRKKQPDRTDTRQSPYTYLFWTRDSLQNIVRRPVKLRDGVTASGKSKFKKTVSASFGMGCILVSNKANLIEDFSEAFAAEYQNIHNVPINLKFGYDDRSPAIEGGFDTDGLNMTVIQDLGTEELVSFRQGNLFSYSWNLRLYLNFVSEFADVRLTPLKKVVVDLYNDKGIPLSYMDFNAQPQWKIYTADDGTQVNVPARPYVEKDIAPLSSRYILSERGDNVESEDGKLMVTEGSDGKE